MRKNHLIIVGLLALILSSCGAPNVAYFNDLGNGQSEQVMQALDIRLRPDDKVSIVVNSKDPQLADLFNLPIVSHRVGYSQTSSTIEYANLGFSVLGEVNRPGRYSFDRDHMTVLDAIGMAGDLTIQGERNNVLVIREVGGQRVNYRINLQSGREVMQSPAFYLQQNDVVYVTPNKFRSRQTTVNGNNVLSASFWISVASLLTSIAVLIVK